MQNANDDYFAPETSPEPTPVADLDNLIAQKERELRPFLLRMEELRLQFIAEFTEFAVQWYEEVARKYVVKYPEVTLAMSKEQLGVMKSRVMALQAATGSLAKKVLADPKVWWHLEPYLHDTSQYELLGNDQVGNRFPDRVDNPVRRILGELGKVLEEFGYNVTTKASQKSAYPEFWFCLPDDELKEAQPFYPHLLVWSVAMQSTIRMYNTQYKDAYVLFVDIEKFKEQKKKQQAIDLWNST